MGGKIKTRHGEIIGSKGSQDRLLEILYNNPAGKFLLKGLTAPVVSKAAGAFYDSALSRRLILPFIKTAGIDMSEYESCSFRSFNEFFTRKIRSERRKIDKTPEAFISPCDSKLSVYKIDEHSRFIIKNGIYSTASLLKCPKLAEKYNSGLCMIFRLEVDDYHRYIYPDNGVKSRNYHIQGKYHTVNPIALDSVDIYKENTREFTILHTENFGDVVQIEVGAMLVGRIKNHHEKYCFKRGEEKGMFEYGGSTVVLMTLPGAVEIDSVFLENTAGGYETIVKMGERIGTGLKFRQIGDKDGREKK